MTPAGIGAAFINRIAHGVNRALATLAANQYLSHHHRHTNQQNAAQVNQHKGPTTIAASYIGELPHIAQTHGRAGSGHNKGPATGPSSMHTFYLQRQNLSPFFMA